jgi:hypothetical protein
MHTLRLCLTSDSNRSVGLRLSLYKGRSLVDEAEVTVDISPEEHLQEGIRWYMEESLDDTSGAARVRANLVRGTLHSWGTCNAPL